MKKVWITDLDRDAGAVQKLMASLETYGLRPAGHFWVDDLKRMAWSSALDEVQAKETALWLIMGSSEKFSQSTIRFGLSMLALSVQFRKGLGFPILLLLSGGEISAASLPTPLKGAEVLPPAFSGLGTRVVSRANMPVQKTDAGYRLYAHALPGIGLWFEAGPSGTLDWQGTLFGVHGAEIDFHGVGPADGIPERAVLEYPVKGMKLQLGNREFTAWAVQNRLNAASSYYVRVQGEPDAILFGPYSSAEEAEVHVISLS